MWKSLSGMITLRITSPNIPGALNKVTASGIIIYNTEIKDEITALLTVKRSDYRKIQSICHSRGDTLHISHLGGIYWIIKGLLKRPLLMAGIAFILFLSLFVPSRILFIRVEGNSLVPTRKILESASNCGIYFGSSRQKVRNEKIKNALLEALPEIQWVGVNTSGCVAIVSVREREHPDTNFADKRVSSIIASRDGVIVDHTITKGNVVCKIGQAVQKGQVLVSGYTDCGISIRAEHSEGDVLAQTERQLSVISPTDYSCRSSQNQCTQKYSIIFGKRRINLFKDSGLSDASCVRMYEENYISLPGGFVLPLAFSKETVIQSNLADHQMTENDAVTLLSNTAANYLQSNMIAGKILGKDESSSGGNGIYRMSGRYSCLEMIGIQHYEEIVKPYGTRN